ncbi:MAG: 50S ribosomal protein L6 [Rhodobacteraceae bacterium]|nr:50S ribosomal protein L6 [Paracoccaceae bacterium]MCY4195740.1 50S ribosomal protein L6 [Paracoccaceae bacterium]MCY4327872.1 50S ribosomal protein L6 [Paracoccaceae bacterium]
MSRVGRNPIELPQGVSASLKGQQIDIKGPKGTLGFLLSSEVTVSVDDKSMTVEPRGQSKRARQLWGTSRSILANCVDGVSKGFRKELQINGVGYRAQMKGSELSLAVGLCHDVTFSPREGLTVSVPSNTQIVIEGIDKQKVGQFAAEIRNARPPEPYKGKGIRYADEAVYLKVGKKK